MVIAVLTAVLMAAVSLWVLKREGIWAEGKNTCLRCITGALLYLAAAILFGQYGYSVWKQERYYILMCALPVLALTDKRSRRIPNCYLAILCVLRLFVLAGELAAYPALWIEFAAHAGIGAAGSFVLMMAAYVLSREKIGLGDVKLITVMGFYLGFSLNYTVLILSLVFAAVWGLSKVWTKKMKLKDSIAFAPFIKAGLYTALLLGL